MQPLRVSPKFQVVIPKEVRESMNIKPGDEVQVFEFEGRIEIVPVRAASSMRGRFPGLNTEIVRERDRV